MYLIVPDYLLLYIAYHINNVITITQSLFLILRVRLHNVKKLSQFKIKFKN